MSLSPCVGHHGISSVDGYALPRDTGATPYIQVLISPYAASGYFAVKAAIMRQALRAWRWVKILTPASYDPANPDRNLAQSLARMNEPIWEYIVCETVETALGPGRIPVAPQTKLGPGRGVLFAAIGQTAAHPGRKWHARPLLDALRATELAVAVAGAEVGELLGNPDFLAALKPLLDRGEAHGTRH